MRRSRIHQVATNKIGANNFNINTDICSPQILHKLFIFHNTNNLMIIYIFQEDKDLEWKYGIIYLYMDYIQHCSTLPPPLNLIPNPRWIINKITGHTCDGCVNTKRYEVNEFFLKYSKLAMLAIKAYVGDNKINSAKRIPHLGLNMGLLMIYSNAFLTEQVLTEGYLTSLLSVHQLTFGFGCSS